MIEKSLSTSKPVAISKQVSIAKRLVSVHGPFQNLELKHLCVEKAKEIGDYLFSHAIMGHSSGKRTIS